MFQWTNILEGILWLTIGVVVFAVHRTRAAAGIALALALFGVSDWIEASTGAWWRPWWLLAVKLACVSVLLTSLIVHLRKRRAANDRSP